MARSFAHSSLRAGRKITHLPYSRTASNARAPTDRPSVALLLLLLLHTSHPAKFTQKRERGRKRSRSILSLSLALLVSGPTTASSRSSSLHASTMRNSAAALHGATPARERPIDSPAWRHAEITKVWGLMVCRGERKLKVFFLQSGLVMMIITTGVYLLYG